MEKVTINGKEYAIDIEKCKKQGLISEYPWYPKDWDEFWHKCAGKNNHSSQYENMDNEVIVMKDESFFWFQSKEEAYAFHALGRLVQLRDWWWDNVCNGWRPKWMNYVESKYVIMRKGGCIINTSTLDVAHALAFPTAEARDKFFDTYRNIIFEAAQFI